MSKYKVGDKVVYEVKEVIRDSVYLLSGWKESEPLSTYTEPLEAKIRRQAAEITRLLAENERLKAENKKMSAKIDAYELYGDQHEEEYNQAFNQGAEAAWELALKLRYMDYEDKLECFGLKHDGEEKWVEIMEKYTYQEAAAKVAQWEKAKEEIKVGDILEDRDEGNKVIVTSLKGRVICLLWDDGRIGTTYIELAKGIFRNTGRHIDIDSFLKQIGEEQ